MGAPLAALLVLSACDGKDSQPARGGDSTAWQIGPVIDGKNYSKGLPKTTAASFTISPTAEPHYITRPTGSLAGKQRIRARFKVEGPADAVIHGAGCPVTSPSALTLYFEVNGPDWNMDGGRWWAKTQRHRPLLVNTEFEIVASFSEEWGSVQSMTSTKNPARFAKDRADAGRIGFTFANCEGSGHGAVATAPVQFTLLEWRVE